MQDSLNAEARRVWDLAWPVSVGMLGLMGMSVVDTLLVGHLGEHAMAGVALGVSWYFALNVVGMGTLRAVDPVITQAFGAGDQEAVARGTVHAVQMALVLAVPLMALQVVAGPGLALLGQPEVLLPIASRWCAIAALGVPGQLLFSALRQSLQAIGAMRPATVAIILANISNLVLGVTLIYGLRLGTTGAAIAFVASQYLLAGLTAWLARDTLRPLFAGWRAAVGAAAMRRLFALGVPLGVQLAMEAWAFHLSGLMMGWLGPREIAANAVVFNLATLSFMVPFGVSTAACTRVGNLVGAGERWGRAAGLSLVLGASAMAASASAFTLFPRFLGGLYTSDPAVLGVIVTLLPIAGAFQLFDGLQVVAFGVLRGAGDVRLPSLANLLGYWALGLPLGWFLAFRAGWGAPGILTGLAIGLASVAMLLLGRVGWIARRGVARVDRG